MTMEDEYDIYGDLDGLDAEAEKDNKAVRELNAQIEKLKSTIEQKESEKQDIASKNAILLENISSLLLTAKAELKRKDTLIADIRREKDNIAFRRGGGRVVRKHDKYTQTTLIQMLDREMQTDVQCDKKRERSPIVWNESKIKSRGRSKSTDQKRERVNYRDRSITTDKSRNSRDKSRGQLTNRNERVMPAWERERLKRREQEREKEQRARRGPRSPDADRRHPAVRFQSPVRIKSAKISVPDSASDVAISKAFIPMNRSELDRYVKEIGRSENRSPVPRQSRRIQIRKETLESAKSELWDKTPPVKARTKVKRSHVPKEIKTPEPPAIDSNVEPKEEMIQSDEIGTTASNAGISPLKTEELVQKLRAFRREPMVRIPSQNLKTENLESKLLTLHGAPVMHLPPLPEPELLENMPPLPEEPQQIQKPPLPEPLKSEELEQMQNSPPPESVKYEEQEQMPPLPESDEQEQMPPLPECEEPEQMPKPPLPEPLHSEELEQMQKPPSPESVKYEEQEQMPPMPESEPDEPEKMQRPPLPESANSEELEEKLLALHGEPMVQIPSQLANTEDLEEELLILHGEPTVKLPPLAEPVESTELEQMPPLPEPEEPEEMGKAPPPEPLTSEENEQIPRLPEYDVIEQVSLLPELEHEEPVQLPLPDQVKPEELEQKLLALHGETVTQIVPPRECHQTSIELLEGLNSEDSSQLLDVCQPPKLIIPPPEPPIIEQVPELSVDEDSKLNDSRELKIIDLEDVGTEQEDEKNSSAETVIEKQTPSLDDELEEGEVVSPPPSVAAYDNDDEGLSNSVTDSTKKVTEKKKRKKSKVLKEKDDSVRHKRNLTTAFHKSASTRRHHHHRSRTHSQRRSLIDKTSTTEDAIPKTKHSERSRSTSGDKAPDKNKQRTLKGLFGSDEESSRVPATGSKRKHSLDSKRDRESKKRKEEPLIAPPIAQELVPIDNSSSKLLKQNSEPSEPMPCAEIDLEQTPEAEILQKPVSENQGKVQEVIVVSNKYCEYRIEVDNEEETTVYVTRKKKKKSKSKNTSLNCDVVNPY